MDKTPEQLAAEAARMRDWRAKNKEKHNEYQKAYFIRRYATDPAFRETRLAQSRAEYQRNKGRAYARQKQYETVEHPLSRTVRQSNYRAKKYGAVGRLVLAEVEAKAAAATPGCHYCGHSPAFSIDHVVPLRSGGSNTLDNVVVCCGWCNSSKRHRDVSDFSPPALAPHNQP